MKACYKVILLNYSVIGELFKMNPYVIIVQGVLPGIVYNTNIGAF